MKMATFGVFLIELLIVAAARPGRRRGAERGGETLKEIGRQFQLEKYSTVSSAIDRMEKKIVNDKKMRRRLDDLRGKIKKSQEKT
jgi:hypothetical protein